MNDVRDIARWKGLLTKYVLTSSWYFSVFLDDRSPGLTYALQREELPFISCCYVTGVLDIGKGGRNSCKRQQFVQKKNFVFTKEFP